MRRHPRGKGRDQSPLEIDALGEIARLAADQVLVDLVGRIARGGIETRR